MAPRDWSRMSPGRPFPWKGRRTWTRCWSGSATRLRPAGRSLARHVRVLRVARADQSAAHPREGVLVPRGRGDWPDCYRVNRYVKGLADSGTDAREVLDTFARWPTWMWANEEVAELAEWLRRHNAGLPDDRKVGFYGLDVYSLWDSLYAVLGYLRKADPRRCPRPCARSAASSPTARTSRSMPAPRSWCRHPARTRSWPC